MCAWDFLKSCGKGGKGLLFSQQSQEIFLEKINSTQYRHKEAGLGHTNGLEFQFGGSELQGIGQFLGPLELYCKELFRAQ